MKQNLKFNVWGVDYNIDPDNNSKISNFAEYIPSLVDGTWEPITFEIFDYVKNSSKNALDIGAWIGPTAIWLSKNFNKVLAIDADLIAAEALEANLRTSECFNTYVLNRPLYSHSANIVFGANQYVPAYQLQGLGASTSQIKTGGFTDKDYVIETITLDQIDEIFPLADVSFAKVDIEGGEEYLLTDLIQAAEQHHWDLLVSFHIHWWNDKNIERFRGLFNNAKDVRFERMENKIQQPDQIIDLLKRHPDASIYFKF